MGDNYSCNNYPLQIYKKLRVLSIHSWSNGKNTKVENHLESIN